MSVWEWFKSIVFVIVLVLFVGLAVYTVYGSNADCIKAHDYCKSVGFDGADCGLFGFHYFDDVRYCLCYSHSIVDGDLMWYMVC